MTDLPLYKFFPTVGELKWPWALSEISYVYDLEKAWTFDVPKETFAGDIGPQFFKPHKPGTVPEEKEPENNWILIHGKRTDNGGTAETNATLWVARWRRVVTCLVACSSEAQLAGFPAPISCTSSVSTFDRSSHTRKGRGNGMVTWPEIRHHCTVSQAANY